jgi:hypothetical protein
VHSFGFRNFKGSIGQLYRFLKRHGTCHRIINGEKDDTPKDVTNVDEKQLKGVIHQYMDEDTYNADETALFHKLALNKTLAFNGE